MGSGGFWLTCCLVYGSCAVRAALVCDDTGQELNSMPDLYAHTPLMQDCIDAFPHMASPPALSPSGSGWRPRFWLYADASTCRVHPAACAAEAHKYEKLTCSRQMRPCTWQGRMIRRPLRQPYHAPCLSVLQVWAGTARTDAGATLARSVCWPGPSSRWVKATPTLVRFHDLYPGNAWPLCLERSQPPVAHCSGTALMFILFL